MRDVREEVLEQVRQADIIECRPGRCVAVRDGFKYAGAIIIPEKFKQLPTTGRIVGVGNEEQQDWIGRRIIWGRYSGVEVQFDKFPAYTVLTYEEILAFLKDDSVTLTQEDLSAMTSDRI